MTDFTCSSNPHQITDSLHDKRHQLYEVTYQPPPIKLMVLADSECGAIEQAGCHKSIGRDMTDATEGVSVKQIPLMVRGWSGSTF